VTQTITPTRTRWWVDLALLAALAALTVALVDGHLLTWDQQVADWAADHRPTLLEGTAHVLNYLGQGGQVLMPVTAILTGWLAWRRRSVRSVLPFVAAFVLTYLTIGPFKIWAGRAAPTFDGPDKTIMFNPYASGTKAMSYPSGHVANALVWYAVVALLLAALLGRALTRREFLAIRVAPVVLVFCTTIYTGFHWLTDSVAGLLLGLVLARLLGRVRWDAIPLPHLGGWERPSGLDAPGS